MLEFFKNCLFLGLLFARNAVFWRTHFFFHGIFSFFFFFVLRILIFEKKGGSRKDCGKVASNLGSERVNVVVVSISSDDYCGFTHLEIFVGYILYTCVIRYLLLFNLLSPRVAWNATLQSQHVVIHAT